MAAIRGTVCLLHIADLIGKYSGDSSHSPPSPINSLRGPSTCYYSQPPPWDESGMHPFDSLRLEFYTPIQTEELDNRRISSLLQDRDQDRLYLRQLFD
jgi:hypothetical protein